MIVFWRLILAYYICAVLFYNRRFFSWRDAHVALSSVLQGVVFALVAGGLCYPFLTENWELADLWPVPGWVALLFITVGYVLLNRLFVYRNGQTKGHTAVFLTHDLLAVLLILIFSPLYTLAQTGQWAYEAWTLFCVGILVVTKMFSIFIYMVEQDLYGRDYPTIDESFVTMMMRLIFFLIILLPGWRWVFWFVIWFWACWVARKNRLMDLSSFALYFSILGAVAVGGLIRWAWYGF